MIERLTFTLTGGYVKLSGLGGSFPAHLTLERLELIDRGGVWLTAEGIAVNWSPWALLERRIAVEEVRAARVDMERTPLGEPSSGGGPVSIPHIDIAQFSLGEVHLGAQLAGRPATLSCAAAGACTRSMMRSRTWSRGASTATASTRRTSSSIRSGWTARSRCTSPRAGPWRTF